MNFNLISPGKNPPTEFNVIIEISAQSDPVSYEADKETGLLFVDGFSSTGMRYPANYGFIPQTRSSDGDPLDVLVITPFPVLAGAVVRCRALGMLEITDESGVDVKLVAVPIDKVSPATACIAALSDVPQNILDHIKYFFENYNAFEVGKRVKIIGWAGLEAAHKELIGGVENFKKCMRSIEPFSQKIPKEPEGR